MEPRIWISEVEFNSNSKVYFGKNDVTVFVGPNNAGKSASLKEIEKLLHSKDNKSIVLKAITIEREGDETDLLSFIELHSREEFKGSDSIYHGLDYNIYGGYAKRCWVDKNDLGDLALVFAHSLSTEARLNAANPASNIRLTSEPLTHPIHYLQKYDELEKKFSDYFRQAFGTDLIVHRNAGKEVPLYVGEKPSLKAGEDRISQSYLNDLEKLDLLQSQGDGMRSFVGVLLNAFVSSHSVLLIDEPEAFLHPPQARLIGKMIAKGLPSERQLFLSTHSQDFLKGLLDANKGNLRIIRIQRDGALNKVSVLDNTDIKGIWNDSLLRHSNVLDGLFHSKVIICESDSDCRFYSAILSAVYDSTDSISPDILFVHCGGKHRMPSVIRSLIKLDVAVQVIADFDILNDINPLKEIFEVLGGAWIDIERDWRTVKNSIDGKRPELETEDFKKEIKGILDSITDRIVSKEKISEIQKTLKKASAWSQAKEIGKPFIPSGDPTNAYDRIQAKLREKGLYIVEVGQLESFCRSVGNHGPKWVNDVMVKDLKTDDELKNARDFIQRVISRDNLSNKPFNSNIDNCGSGGKVFSSASNQTASIPKGDGKKSEFRADGISGKIHSLLPGPLRSWRKSPD